MADFRGYEADILIDGILYVCSRFRVIDETTEKDLTIAEDAGYGDSIDDIRSAEITLEHMTYADDANPFGVVAALFPRQEVPLQIWPEGFQSGQPWDFSCVRVKSIQHEGDASLLQPITVVLKSRGRYSAPNE